MAGGARNLPLRSTPRACSFQVLQGPSQARAERMFHSGYRRGIARESAAAIPRRVSRPDRCPRGESATTVRSTEAELASSRGLVAGLLLRSWHFPPPAKAIGSVAFGVPWGTAQQYGLLCVFYRRLRESLGGDRLPIVSADPWPVALP